MAAKTVFDFKKKKKGNVDLREGLWPSNLKTSGPPLTFVLEDFLDYFNVPPVVPLTVSVSARYWDI